MFFFGVDLAFNISIFLGNIKLILTFLPNKKGDDSIKFEPYVKQSDHKNIL